MADQIASEPTAGIPVAPKRANGRSLAHFPRRSTAEDELLAACAKGEPCIIDVTRPEAPTNENVVRAGLVRFLALGGDDDAPVHEHGVQLRSAWIDDVLDLRETKLERPLALVACRLEAIEAERCVVPSLTLSGSRVTGAVDLRGLRCDGSVLLDGDFTAESGATLREATIGGSLRCSGGKFYNRGDCALDLRSARIAGNVFLNELFLAKGEVDLYGATIGGTLTCTAGRFIADAQHRFALRFSNAAIGGTVELDNGFRAIGLVRLANASVGRSLNLNGAKLFGTGRRPALVCRNLVAAGDVTFSENLRAIGLIDLTNATIGGGLSFRNATLRSADGVSLEAYGAVVAGDLVIDHVEAVGEVRLLAAKVGQNLDCQRTRITSRSEDALQCQRIAVSGALVLWPQASPVPSI